MTKIRRFFAIATLVAALGGLSLQGAGASLTATTIASQHVSSISSVQSGKLVAFKLHPPCPGSTTMDC